MSQMPYLKPPYSVQEMQDVFLGYNNNVKIGEEEWNDMRNVSPRSFPMFASRAKRSKVKTLVKPLGLIARDALVYIDGTTVYINELAIEGVTLSNAENMLPKTIASMGAYIVIFPDRVFINTAKTTEFGNLDSTFSYSQDVLYTPARIDGTDLSLEGAVISPTAPLAPADKDYWIDTSAAKDVLRQYSELSEYWTEIPAIYTKIALPGIGDHFKKFDGVEISGCAYTAGVEDETATKQISELNGSKVLYDVKDGYVIVQGILHKNHTQTTGTVKIERKAPDMDFVIESENRLWGCKYGLVGDKTVNEIYCCAQGDFKNWTRYLGVSTDSYAASIGSDGKFTGAYTFQGYPTFFKELSMHRVYGNMPSNYQIDSSACRGVQEGSHKSLIMVDEKLYYKGRTEVLCYDGSVPYSIGQALGNVAYKDAVAGSFKERYYISMSDGTKYTLFYCDTLKKIWYKEDDTQVTDFAQTDDDLYFITGNNIMSEFGTKGVKEEAVEFMATTGIIGYNYPNRKYVSRLNIRAILEKGASLHVSFRYDSRGDWWTAGSLTGVGLTRTTMLPLKPRRCDHFEMKLEGVGDVQVFSISKILEIGGDGGWW